MQGRQNSFASLKDGPAAAGLIDKQKELHIIYLARRLAG
jgi:hypothetical protein